MIESPLLNEMMAKTSAQRMHKAIVAVLETRFRSVPDDVGAAVRTVYDEDKLDELLRAAVSSRNLETFRACLGM